MGPAADRQPEPRTHTGYEWIYVLSGRLRLILGEHDVVLGAGEAAECSESRASGSTCAHDPPRRNRARRHRRAGPRDSPR
ncbi:cupin domain-containing protein [Lacisediminihabitans sp.]|uniref:cupin domain-containing protein n=1 Tax=Lacisediminihabitans sp. TaxID=2787631 RepID=UPI00374D203E